jgi:FMN phosphatase YigB (HAD superfamily)
VTGELGIARWLASADVPVRHRRFVYDGIFAVALRDGLCTEFREWWNTSEVPTREDTVYLFDVDDTLLDNDALAEDLRRHLTDEFGAERQQRYWDEFERLRAELGYADYLGALQRFRAAYPHDSHLLTVSDWLIDYPFADRLYAGALELLAGVRARARAVILSDGDVVFQPRKVRRSGLWDAVDGNVLIYVHKERELEEVERRYPADRYVLVDDKLAILTAVKEAWGDRVVTVFAQQGHYARDPEIVGRYPPADVTVERIGDLHAHDLVAV